MEACRIKTYYVMRSDPRKRYTDSFYLDVDGEFKQDGPNTWTGAYGKAKITVVQRHQHHDISEQDVQVEPNPSYIEDPEISYAAPSPSAVAAALNEHLNRIYGS